MPNTADARDWINGAIQWIDHMGKGECDPKVAAGAAKKLLLRARLALPPPDDDP